MSLIESTIQQQQQSGRTIVAQTIVKSIQDLKALSELYLDNALSKLELEECKTRVLGTLGISREHLTIAEMLEPLALLREIYLSGVLTIEQYKLARALLSEHTHFDNGGVELYSQIFNLYKQGLLSVYDLHNYKQTIVGENNFGARTGESNNINRLRVASNPFVAGKLVDVSNPVASYEEISEGQWRSQAYPSGPTYTDIDIMGLYTIGGYTLNWGIPVNSLIVPANVIRSYISKGTYVESEVLIQIQGLTELEMGDLVLELVNIQATDSMEVIEIFRKLLPIVTP